MVKGQKKSEIILYAVLWTILFAAPMVSMFVGEFFTTASDDEAQVLGAAQSSSPDWMGVVSAWGLLAMFFITFFIHNFLIAPLLVYRNRKWAYGITACALIVAFTLFQVYGRPHRPRPIPERRMNTTEKKMVHQDGEPRPGRATDENREPMPGPPGMEKPPMENPPMRQRRPDINGKADAYEKPDAYGKPDTNKKPDDHEPPRVFGGQDSVAFIIMILLLGLNIGVKSYFKSQDDRKRMKELERENLTNQLAYLKYQINPHFFMNTLNNIHALVDIDPEQAKYTIEVLSKMMRYVLYEGNKSMAPLQKELDFITNYIELMRIRYTDKVRISISLPQNSSEDDTPHVSSMHIEVPSMLLITFVENAFKHGVSYQNASFIEVSVRVDEVSREVEFLCNNSRKPVAEDKHGGVGLANAQKRLQLIYGKDGYSLRIDSDDKEYRVLLRLATSSKIKAKKQ